jgi:catechol 2,3-dioxygenase-like lactoylglutathione lyase family enzyme
MRRTFCLLSGLLTFLFAISCLYAQELTEKHSPAGLKTMIDGVDNIGICVADLKKSVEFYQALGFTKAYENERGVTMVAGTAKLFIFQTRKTNSAPVTREFTLFQNPPGIDHISFAVEDVDRLYADAKAKGIVFNSEPKDQPWGARMVSLRDPDGINLYLLKWLKK